MYSICVYNITDTILYPTPVKCFFICCSATSLSETFALLICRSCRLQSLHCLIHSSVRPESGNCVQSELSRSLFRCEKTSAHNKSSFSSVVPYFKLLIFLAYLSFYVINLWACSEVHFTLTHASSVLRPTIRTNQITGRTSTNLHLE